MHGLALLKALRLISSPRISDVKRNCCIDAVYVLWIKHHYHLIFIDIMLTSLCSRFTGKLLANVSKTVNF